MRNVALRILRGALAQLPTLFAGELYWTTDTNDLLVGNGVSNTRLSFPVYDVSGNRLFQPHAVTGSVTLGGGGNTTVTLPAITAFTSAVSYTTTVSCKNAKRALQVNQTSGTQFIITGSGGDVIYFHCIGN